MRLTVIAAVAALCLGAAACGAVSEPSSDVQQSREQETALREAQAQMGSPNVVNFTRRRLLKDIIEMLDRPNLVTFTYTFSEMTGRPLFFCNSIGYPFPFSTQYSNPMQISYRSSYGIAVLPQAEPDGTFPPSSSEASWVLCIDPDRQVASPVYSEPRLMVAQFRLTPDTPQAVADVRIEFTPEAPAAPPPG